MNRSRNNGLDILKLIGSFLVVIVHGFEPGVGLREYLYLLGSYGIPVFFVVNGYLRSEGHIGRDLLKRYFRKYIIFVLVWSFFLSIPYVILENEFVFFALLKGGILGTGLLFHFWFFTAIIVIYIIIAILYKVFREDKIKQIIRKRHFILYVLGAFSVVFVFNFLLFKHKGVEVREIVPAPFRILTNCGYYMIGMHIGLLGEDFAKFIKKIFCHFQLHLFFHL